VLKVDNVTGPVTQVAVMAVKRAFFIIKIANHKAFVAVHNIFGA
jgi:hypothetical protein